MSRACVAAAGAADLLASCRHSAAAYSASPEQARRALRAQGARMVSWYGGRRSAQAYLARVGEGRLVCAFRGTLNPRDMLDACDVRAAPAVVGLRAHRGFLHRFRCLERSLTMDLWHAAHAEPGGLLEVCFTGHSMGGGLAAIAAAHYAARWRRRGERGPVVSCHAFGAPVFCEPSLLAACDHVAVVLRDDVVAAAQLHSCFGYLPNTLELDAEGRACACVLPSARPLGALGVVAGALRLGGPGTHGCAEYEAALARWLRRDAGDGGGGGDLFPGRMA